MQDIEIRKALHSHLEILNQKISNTIIIDELDLCSGLARIDIAVVNGAIHGYEIKSEEDTLKRLDNQIENYNKSFELITIATNPVHLQNIKSLVPRWWGILLVKEQNGQIKIVNIRGARDNPLLKSQSILEFLWKDELHKIATQYNISFRKGDSRKILREKISRNLRIKKISYEVRDALKSRKNWRSCSTATVK